MLKKIIDMFGYVLVRKHSPQEVNNAFMHNALDTVNRLNEDSTYFENNVEKEQYFSSCIYPYIIKAFTDKDLAFLDVGCGSGVLVGRLCREYSSSKISGCDFSDTKISKCKEYYNINTFFVHDINEAFVQKYDLITCTEVLEHLKTPDIALNNLFNALNIGGLLIITVPDGRVDRFFGHIHLWSYESFQLFVRKTIEYYSCLSNYSINFDYVCEKNYVEIKRNK